MNNLILSLIFNTLIALYAIKKKSFKPSGLITSFICGFITCIISPFLYLILFLVYLLTTITDKMSNKVKQKIEADIEVKGKKRDFEQVISNIGVGTTSLLIFFFTGNDIFALIYAIVMASSLSDSMSSNLGCLSNKRPIDISTLKPVPNGLSGAVSLVGLSAALIGSFIIGITWYIYTKSIVGLIIITLIGFLGSLIDSLLGSLIQVKYKCKKCNTITEKKEHCNKETENFSGYRIINNDMVNLLTNLIIFFISLFILVI